MNQEHELDEVSTTEFFSVVQNQTNQFLLNNRRKVLAGKGEVSHDTAMDKAEKEYEVLRIKQDREYVSEFDREVEKYLREEN